MIKFYCDRCSNEVSTTSDLHSIDMRHNNEDSYRQSNNYKFNKSTPLKIDVCANCWMDIYNFAKTKPNPNTTD